MDSKLPNVGTTIFTTMSALANEHQAINLSQGFPNFDCSQRLKDLVNHYVQSGHNQYAPMAGVKKLRDRLADKLMQSYKQVIDPDKEITVVAGGTQGLFTAITAFIKPGDEVIIIEPAYDSYQPSIEVNGGITVVYELTAPQYKIDWDQLANLVTSKTKMVIINTPQNPTGKILKKEDLFALESLAIKNDLLILSDEVYEHLVYDKQAHQSVLAYPRLWERSIAVYSFGKTFHSTGWKLGYVVAPGPLMKEFRKVHQFNVFSVNRPIQEALADFLEDPNEYLSLSSFYQKKRDLFRSILDASPFEALDCEGTYFHLAAYGHLSQEADLDFAKRMTSEYGVAVIPTSAFYSNGRDDKVIRFCFAKTEEVLRQAEKKLHSVTA